MRLTVIILLFCYWNLSSSVLFIKTSPQVGFGIKISIQANGELLTYMVFQKNANNQIIKRFLSRDQFIKHVSGYWPFPYNPKRINYFELNKIDCGCVKDSLFKIEYIYCDPFDSLWKIRFANYPFQGKTDVGWSQDIYKPSYKQMLFLKDNFDIKNIDSDYFIDSSLWKLLYNVQDENWINQYQSIW